MSTSKDNIMEMVEDLRWILSDIQNVSDEDCIRLVNIINPSYSDYCNEHTQNKKVVTDIKKWIKYIVKKSQKKIVDRDVQYAEEEALAYDLHDGIITISSYDKKMDKLEKKYNMHKNFKEI